MIEVIIRESDILEKEYCTTTDAVANILKDNGVPAYADEESIKVACGDLFWEKRYPSSDYRFVWLEAA